MLEKMLVLFLVVATTALEYKHIHVDAGKDVRFDALLFTLQLDQEITLDGIPLVNLSMAVPPGVMFPDAITRQFGGSSLICNGGDIVFDSVATQMDGPPDFLIPGLPVEDGTSVLFSLFAGSFNASRVRALSRTFTAMKITRFFDGRSQQWLDLVPPSLNVSSCMIALTPSFYNVDGTFGDAQPVQGDCQYEQFVETWQAMQTLMDGVADESQMWHVASLAVSDAWQNCAQLVSSLFVLGNATKTIVGTKECYAAPYSAEWLSDACCNDMLQFEQCCAPRTVSAVVPGITGVKLQRVTDHCAHPVDALAVVARHVKTQTLTGQCDAIAQRQGADWEVTRDLSQFVETCFEELFGGQSGPPTCLSDDDCYTSCDTRSNTCVIPYDSPDAPLLECFADHIDPLLERHWRREWQLNGTSSSEDFKAAFVAHLYDDACVGPTAHLYNSKWVTEQVANCSDVDYGHCWCYHGIPTSQARQLVIERLYTEKRMHVSHRAETGGGDCYHSYEVPADQAACEAEMTCNWDQSKPIGECTGGQLTTHFCGECNAGQCADRTVQPMCYTWVESTQRCVDQGGTIGPWGLWHCVFGDLTTEEQCLPTAFCPPRPDGTLGDNWCPAMCVAQLNETECENTLGARSELYVNRETVLRRFMETPTDELHEQLLNLNYLLTRQTPGKWWNAERGVCQVNLWGQSCVNNNDTQWFAGRAYRPGVLDTSEKCGEGRCSVDERMTAAQCAATASCNKPCFRCRPRDWGKTLCYNTALTTLEDCVATGGELDTYCVYDMLRSQSECVTANASNVFESCESDETCTGLSTFGNDRLQCYPNHWDRCETQQECEATGDCDDWDFQNWFSPTCWSDSSAAKSSACTGVCIKPFTIVDGWPQCISGNGAWTRIGCADYTITSSETCAMSNGTWTERAFDASSCAAHGSGCKERKYWTLTPKNEQTCEACGGQSHPFYNWRAGVWSTGEMVPLTWKARAYEATNRWAPTLNWNKLHESVNRAARSVIARAIKSSLMCKYNLIAATIQSVACDCTDGGANRTACFDTQIVPISDQEYFSGIGGTTETLRASVSVSEDAIDNSVDTGIVKVYAVEQVIETEHTRRARSPYAPNEYEVVMNNISYVVGQLVGQGVTVEIPEGITIVLCLNLDPDIPLDPEMIYPVPDFGGFNATHTPQYWPDGLDIMVLSGPDRYCANISESGTYFPIRRLADWETATGIAPTPVPTATPTPMPTATPTSAPTATPTSAPTATPTSAPTSAPLNPVTIGGIVVACVFGVAFITVFIVVCVRMCKEPAEFVEMERKAMPIKARPRKVQGYHGLKYN